MVFMFWSSRVYHARASPRQKNVIPVKTGTGVQALMVRNWIPAFAGKTVKEFRL